MRRPKKEVIERRTMLIASLFWQRKLQEGIEIWYSERNYEEEASSGLGLITIAKVPSWVNLNS